MNAWNDWAKIAFSVVSLAVPTVGLAAGFDFDDGEDRAAVVVTDATAESEAAAPVEHVEDESVLVPSPLTTAPVVVEGEIEGGFAHDPAAIIGGGMLDGPISGSFPESSLPCTACGSQGCTTCTDAAGCRKRGRRPGWHEAAGYFNRVLGDACPRWVAQVDALMLWQGNIASQPMLAAPATGATVLDANQAQTLMSAGPRFGLFLNLDECYAIEGNYFNVGIFPGDAAFTPAGTYTLSNVPTPTPVTSASGFELFSRSRIQSAEMNWRRRQCGYPITWLAGFRWVQWNSLLQFQDAAVPPQSGLTSITGNDLYGGQIGADLGLWNSGGRFTVNGVGKAGVFYNNAFQRSYRVVQGPILQGPVSAAAEQTSFFGEVGVNSSLRLTNWLSWRAGYSLFWLSAVAVPADQMALTTMPAGPATINTNGSVLLHGVTTGLEARW
jgi:hypothetical protein